MKARPPSGDSVLFVGAILCAMTLSLHCIVMKSTSSIPSVSKIGSEGAKIVAHFVVQPLRISDLADCAINMLTSSPLMCVSKYFVLKRTNTKMTVRIKSYFNVFHTFKDQIH